MATEVFINIKDLPEITEIGNGQYIPVETATGTHIIDFKNFIVPTANTVITTTVDQNTSAIISLSSGTSSQIISLSSSIDTNTTKIASLSDSLNVLNSSVTVFNNVYVGKAQITISSGNKQSSGTLSPSLSTLAISDLIIVPTNSYASRFPAYATDVTDIGLVTIKAPFTRMELISGTVSLTAIDISAEADATYNVLAIKKL